VKPSNLTEISQGQRAAFSKLLKVFEHTTRFPRAQALGPPFNETIFRKGEAMNSDLKYSVVASPVLGSFWRMKEWK
jgi:hypothetical protein